jgi:hypothetical protein
MHAAVEDPSDFIGSKTSYAWALRRLAVVPRNTRGVVGLRSACHFQLHAEHRTRWHFSDHHGHWVQYDLDQQCGEVQRNGRIRDGANHDDAGSRDSGGWNKHRADHGYRVESNRNEPHRFYDNSRSHQLFASEWRGGLHGDDHRNGVQHDLTQ